MLSFDDIRWSEMIGGYRTRFDPRPLLKRLQTEGDTSEVWEALWNELHHQGDVGEASFAAVPHLVAAYRERGVADWNTFSIVAVIELARKKGRNPDVPGWLEQDYFDAIRQLAQLGAANILLTENAETSRAILSVLAIDRGLRTHGKFLLDYSEEEMLSVDPPF